MQTFADISLVKSCHMCDLQHHGTDLFGPFMFNLCLRGGLGWWFGSLGIDGFVNLEKTKKYQTLQTMKSLKIKKTNLKQQ